MVINLGWRDVECLKGIRTLFNELFSIETPFASRLGLKVDVITICMFRLKKTCLLFRIVGRDNVPTPPATGENTT